MAILSCLMLVIAILSCVNIYNRLFNRRKGRSLMVIFGSGGHTTEMLLMLEALDPKKYTQIHIVVAETDTWSMTKIK